MKTKLLLFLVFLGCQFHSTAAGINLPAVFYLATGGDTVLVDLTVSPEEYNSIQNDTVRNENKRLISSILAVALGPFGAHRIYLGSSHLVPVFYVITLGGGLGILPVIDLALILFSKDITPYEENKKFFMWVN